MAGDFATNIAAGGFITRCGGSDYAVAHTLKLIDDHVGGSNPIGSGS
jgi:hypothetical protein